MSYGREGFTASWEKRQRHTRKVKEVTGMKQADKSSFTSGKAPQTLEQIHVVVSRHKTADFTAENRRERNGYFATSRNHIYLHLQSKAMM